MAYFLGLLLIVFILIDWLRNRGRQMRELVLAMYPVAIVTGAIAATLFTYFGMASLIRSLIPTQGSAIYRALDLLLCKHSRTLGCLHDRAGCRGILCDARPSGKSRQTD